MKATPRIISSDNATTAGCTNNLNECGAGYFCWTVWFVKTCWRTSRGWTGPINSGCRRVRTGCTLFKEVFMFKSLWVSIKPTNIPSTEWWQTKQGWKYRSQGYGQHEAALPSLPLRTDLNSQAKKMPHKRLWFAPCDDITDFHICSQILLWYGQYNLNIFLVNCF